MTQFRASKCSVGRSEVHRIDYTKRGPIQNVPLYMGIGYLGSKDGGPLNV